MASKEEIMNHKIEETEETAVDVKMYPSEIKRVLELLYQDAYKGYRTCTTIGEWAAIAGGLPQHLVEILDKSTSSQEEFKKTCPL